MLPTDPVFRNLSDVEGRQRLEGRRKACQVISKLVRNMFLRTDARLVKYVLKEDWIRVKDFFARIEQGRDVRSFDAAELENFAGVAQAQMAAHDLKSTDLDENRSVRVASKSPDPRPVQQAVDVPLLVVGVVALVVLAIVGSWVVSAVGGAWPDALPVTKEGPTCRAEIMHDVEIMVAGVKAQYEAQYTALEQRMQLQETASAAAEVSRNKVQEEGLAAAGKRHDEQINAFLLLSQEALTKFGEASKEKLAQVDSSVLSLQTRIGEGLVKLQAHELRLTNVKQEMDANAADVSKASDLAKGLFGKLNVLDENIKTTTVSHNKLVGEQHEASQKLESSQMILWYAISVIFVICATTSCWNYSFVLHVDRACLKFKDFETLQTSHQRLAQRVDAIVAEQEQAAAPGDVPAGPGVAAARGRARGRASA